MSTRKLSDEEREAIGSWCHEEMRADAEARCRTSSDLTIEFALKELREMFPGWHCEISTANYIGSKTDRLYARIDIHCTDFQKNDLTESAASLDSAMDRVRGYWKEQTK